MQDFLPQCTVPNTYTAYLDVSMLLSTNIAPYATALFSSCILHWTNYGVTALLASPLALYTGPHHATSRLTIRLVLASSCLATTVLCMLKFWEFSGYNTDGVTSAFLEGTQWEGVWGIPQFHERKMCTGRAMPPPLCSVPQYIMQYSAVQYSNL